MKIFFIVCAVLAVSACTTAYPSTPPESHTGRMLCMKTRVANEITIDCLNSLNADPVEVWRRVALYNNGEQNDHKIGCKKRQALGSKLTRWRCTRLNRSGNPTDEAIGIIELIDKSNNR